MNTLKHYTILEEIGSGGMGTVFKAQDTQTGDFVAIKQLQSDIATLQPEILERFRREGEILRQLNHPNIVKWLDAITIGNQSYLVMEYIHGGDLYDLLNETLPPLQRTLDIALDIADALTRTHRLNIVHRDLKPANVLIAADGTPRLTDFGLAREATTSDITRRGSIIGTLYYLPPEIIRGEEADHLADIWSFGVMLFQMVTGELPFQGHGQAVILQMILQQPAPDIEALHPAVPVPLADLIYRMLDKDKNARIPSVRLVGAEIEALLKQVNLPLSFAPTDMTGYEGETLIIREKVTSRFAEPKPSVAPNNLPANLMPFVGRNVELSALEGLLQDPAKRLVSIVGIGGIGKTRLALEIAQRQLGHWRKGVFFIDLAPLPDPDEILNAMASALSFQFYAGVSPLQQLIDFLQDKPILLILDNFEHLLAGVTLIDKILRDVAETKIVTTSRERLNLQYETIFTIDGLEFRSWSTVDEALAESIVQLFMQSAKRADPAFMLQVEHLPNIYQICQMVEGLPLGILLAAGWINMLSPQEIADELTQSADFLETEMHNIPERHRSMRTVFAYSWQLLNEVERTIFSQLAVFSGGFTREAAQQITGTSLRTLLNLVNKSLIQRSPEGRFSIHAMLHQYTREELHKLNQAETLHTVHSTYFLGRLKAREADSRDGQQLVFSQDVTREWSNIVAAWHWAIDHHQSQVLVDCAFVMRQYLRIRNAWWLARPLYDYSLAGISEHLEIDSDYVLWIILKYDASAFNRDGRLSKALADELCPLVDKYPLPTEYQILLGLLRGDVDNDIEYLQTVYQQALVSQDKLLIARSLAHLGDYYTFVERNLAEGKSHYQLSLKQALDLQNAVIITKCYNSLGQIASMQEDYRAGINYYEKALDLNQQFGNQTSVANCYNNMALETMILREFEQAIAYAQQALAIHQELGNHYDYTLALDTLANIYYVMEDYSKAEMLIGQTIEACIAGDWQIDLAFAYKQMGFIQLAIAKPEQAQHYFGRCLLTAPDDLPPSDMIYIDAVGGLAHLIAQRGELERAYSIVYFVSLQDGIDRHFDDEQALVEHLENQLDAEVIRRLTVEAQALNMDELVTQLRTEFGTES